jgi:hypothetical protein
MSGHVRTVLAVERKDDGELFTLNEDHRTFSNERMKRDYPDHIHHKWPIEAFSPAHFRIVSWKTT